MKRETAWLIGAIVVVLIWGIALGWAIEGVHLCG